MPVDDILYSPVERDPSGFYQVWFVPQPYHDLAVRSMGEFVTVFTPNPIKYEEAEQIIAEKFKEGFDIQPLVIRRIS